jgi:hypothetical protein
MVNRMEFGWGRFLYFSFYYYASRGQQEKSQKAPERNNGFHYESDIAGNIRKFGEEISLDVSRNG